MNATTMTTGLTRRIEAVDGVNQLAFLVGHVFHYLEEHPEGEVTHLATPQPLHAPQVQGFKEQHIVAVGQLVGQFEEPVFASVAHPLVSERQLTLGLTTVVRPLLLAGQVAVGLPDCDQRLLEEQGRRYLICAKAIVKGQEGLETEVNPRHFTGRGLERRLGNFLSNTQIEITNPVALDRNRLDLSGQLSIFDVFVDPAADPDPVVIQEAIPGLLERETGILAGLLETRWPDPRPDLAGSGLEKQPVAPLYPLSNVLQGLRGDMPQPLILGLLFEFGQMLHQGVLVQGLARQLVVALMQRDTVVVGSSTERDGVTQVAISFRLVESILIGGYHQHTLWGSVLIVAQKFYTNKYDRSGLKPCRRKYIPHKGAKALLSHG